jgi:hypothetical protein
MQASLSGFALAACVSAWGCSSTSNGSQGPDCTMFAACGGDVVGTWKVDRACVGGTTSPLTAQCLTATFQVSETVDGTVEFTSDGMFTQNVTATLIEDLTLPPSCLQGTSCAQLQSTYNQTDGSGARLMGTCTEASGGCSCHVTATQSGPQHASYSVSGTTLTIGGQTVPYCVHGSGLLYRLSAGTMGMAGAGTVTYTFAATRE